MRHNPLGCPACWIASGRTPEEAQWFASTWRKTQAHLFAFAQRGIDELTEYLKCQS